MVFILTKKTVLSIFIIQTDCNMINHTHNSLFITARARRELKLEN